MPPYAIGLHGCCSEWVKICNSYFLQEMRLENIHFCNLLCFPSPSIFLSNDGHVDGCVFFILAFKKTPHSVVFYLLFWKFET
jgi:hypothetical protein